jgi:hypothetical protein
MGKSIYRAINSGIVASRYANAGKELKYINPNPALVQIL